MKETRFPIWAIGLVMVGYFAFCWMNLIPFGDELQQFPRALHTLHPEWISGDIFVGSPQGDHWVFFRFLSLLFWIAGPVGGAVLARIVIWVLMAAAILSLGRSLRIGLPALLMGVAIFVAHDQSRLGGETIVGEAIARHLAYPLVLFALSAWIRGTFLVCGALLGVAFSVHVLVGAWAAAILLPLMFLDERVRLERRLQIGPAIVCVLTALPGLVPILPLVHSSEVVGSALADDIFISFRHPHHLQPGSWLLGDYLHFVLMIGAFLLLTRWNPSTMALTRLRQFVWLMVVVTAFGLAVGIVVRDAFFLKLHPYRFAPPLMTFFVALLLAQYVLSLRSVPLRRIAIPVVAVVAAWHSPRGAYRLYCDLVERTELEQSRMDALQWVQRATPPDAQVLANPAWSDVQWRSRRASAVSFKLVPFDPNRVIDWYERLTSVVPQPPWFRPGHEMMEWISSAFDNAHGNELIRIAGQLEADVAISRLPCELKGLAYANEHYCVHSVSGELVPRQNHIVVRYDDYSPISPYEGPPRSIETERRLFNMAETHGGKVAVGVIPFPRATIEGAAGRLDSTAPGSSWLSKTSDPWVVLLREAVERGVVEPALHGFEHRRTTRQAYRPGEFRWRDANWQFDALQKGRDALALALNGPVRVFIPPWNAWDAATLTALEQLDIEVLSPDLHHAEVQSPGVRIFPQGTADPWEALRIMKEMPDPDGSVMVLVTHPFDFERIDGLGEEYFKGVEEVFRFAQESPAWSSAGFLDVPPERPEVWESRIRSAVAMKGVEEKLRDLRAHHFTIGSTALVRPNHWYQDHRWRSRLSLILFLGIPAIVMAWLVRATARRLGRVAPLIAGFLVTWAMLAYLVAGALGIVERGYAVRGLRLFAISLVAGAAVGLVIALARSKGRSVRPYRGTGDAIHERHCERTTVPV